MARDGLLAVGVFMLLALSPAVAETGSDAWWWDNAWWSEGILHADVSNHRVAVERIHYEHDGIEIPAVVMRPEGAGNYPAILWVHGRRGLDALAEGHVRRLAARGFVVLAPDLFSGRFIPEMPIEHDYVLEEDLNAGLDVLLARSDIIGEQACTVSITRGGYYALKLATTHRRQNNGLACWVGYYPHVQDPNAPEAMQVYRYANEFNDLQVPVLILVGEEEQYQRLRTIRMATEGLRQRNGEVRLIEYPGVGRGFDFRNGSSRTFADDLASRDAMLRTSSFLNSILEHK